MKYFHICSELTRTIHSIFANRSIRIRQQIKWKDLTLGTNPTIRQVLHSAVLPERLSKVERRRLTLITAKIRSNSVLFHFYYDPNVTVRKRLYRNTPRLNHDSTRSTKPWFSKASKQFELSSQCIWVYYLLEIHRSELKKKCKFTNGRFAPMNRMLACIPPVCLLNIRWDSCSGVLGNIWLHQFSWIGM